jgi:predicted PurR-regulated permease PerM
MRTKAPPKGPPAVTPVPRPLLPGSLRETAQRVTVIVLVTLLIVALAYVLWSGINVVLETFAGVLFGIFLEALARRVGRHTGLSYGWSLAVALAALFVVVGVGGWLLSSRLTEQLMQLSHELPRARTAVQDYLKQYEWGQMLLEHAPSAAASLTAEVSDFSRVTGFVSGAWYFLLSALVIFFVGLFGAAEPELYRAGVLHLIPPPYRPRAAEAMDALMFNLRRWLLGQAFLMVTIGITTALGLWLIGVPLALALGIIAGVLEMVPYIGPWISAVPAALIALLISPTHLILTLALFLFLHILEGYILLPLVQRHAVLMPPALTLVMQVLLGDLMGILGLFVAAPLTVVLVVLCKMLYVEDTLGDQAVNVPGEPGNDDKPARAGIPEESAGVESS